MAAIDDHARVYHSGNNTKVSPALSLLSVGPKTRADLAATLRGVQLHDSNLHSILHQNSIPLVAGEWVLHQHWLRKTTLNPMEDSVLAFVDEHAREPVTVCGECGRGGQSQLAGSASKLEQQRQLARARR